MNLIGLENIAETNARRAAKAGLPTTLESMPPSIDAVAVLKIDLEGAKERALAGTGDALLPVEAVIVENSDGDGIASVLAARGVVAQRRDGNNAVALNSASRS